MLACVLNTPPLLEDYSNVLFLNPIQNTGGGAKKAAPYQFFPHQFFPFYKRRN